MKITIETTIDGKKETIEHKGDFAFVFTGNDTKKGQEINQFLHFEKVETKDFDNKRALLAEFVVIKSLLSHFEKALNAKLGVMTYDNANDDSDDHDFLKFLSKLIKE